MKKTVFRGTGDAGTPVADPPSHSGGRVRSERRLTTGIPRWVKVFLVIILILVLLFVIMHVTGHGFGGHMHMSILEQGAQPL